MNPWQLTDRRPTEVQSILNTGKSNPWKYFCLTQRRGGALSLLQLLVDSSSVCSTITATLLKWINCPKLGAFPKIWVTRKERKKEEGGKKFILLLENLSLISFFFFKKLFVVLHVFRHLFFLQLDWVKCCLPSMLICGVLSFKHLLVFHTSSSYRESILSLHFFVSTKCFTTLLRAELTVAQVCWCSKDQLLSPMVGASDVLPRNPSCKQGSIDLEFNWISESKDWSLLQIHQVTVVSV